MVPAGDRTLSGSPGHDGLGTPEGGSFRAFWLRGTDVTPRRAPVPEEFPDVVPDRLPDDLHGRFALPPVVGRPVPAPRQSADAVFHLGVFRQGVLALAHF